MGISYDRLFKLLIDKKLKKTDLKTLCDISAGTLAKLSKEETVSMEVLMKICKVLECDFGDIVEYIPEEGHK